MAIHETPKEVEARGQTYVRWHDGNYVNKSNAFDAITWRDLESQLSNRQQRELHANRLFSENNLKNGTLKDKESSHGY